MTISREGREEEGSALPDRFAAPRGESGYRRKNKRKSLLFPPRVRADTIEGSLHFERRGEEGERSDRLGQLPVLLPRVPPVPLAMQHYRFFARYLIKHRPPRCRRSRSDERSVSCRQLRERAVFLFLPPPLLHPWPPLSPLRVKIRVNVLGVR